MDIQPIPYHLQAARPVVVRSHGSCVSERAVWDRLPVVARPAQAWAVPRVVAFLEAYPEEFPAAIPDAVGRAQGLAPAADSAAVPAAWGAEFR